MSKSKPKLEIYRTGRIRKRRRLKIVSNRRLPVRIQKNSRSEGSRSGQTTGRVP